MEYNWGLNPLQLKEKKPNEFPRDPHQKPFFMTSLIIENGYGPDWMRIQLTFFNHTNLIKTSNPPGKTV